jgi:hypothetical protein
MPSSASFIDKNTKRDLTTQVIIFLDTKYNVIIENGLTQQRNITT